MKRLSCRRDTVTAVTVTGCHRDTRDTCASRRSTNVHVFGLFASFMQTIKIYKPELLINAPFGVKNDKFAAIWWEKWQVCRKRTEMYR
jgi:hypothetical protein